MKFGFAVPGLTLFPPQRQEPWEHSITGAQMVAIARHADQLGFDYLFVPWHIVLPAGEWVDNMGPRWPHSVAASGLLLGATTRIRVCAHVVLPCEPPLHLAKALATIDWMSDGRLIPVILTGYNRTEFDILGADFEHRNAVVDEYMEVLQTLWSDEVAEHHGAFADFSAVVCDPKPVQRPMPVWFGGKASSRRALRRVATWGSGWLSYASRHDEHPGAIEFIRAQPGYDPSRALEIAAYFEEPTHDPDTHKEEASPAFVVGEDAVIERVEYLSSLGITATLAAMHAKDDGHGRMAPIRSVEEYLDRMSWFAETVFPRAGR